MEEIARFPNHIAIIMDGNRRWAEERGLPTISGHRAGVENMRCVMDYLGERKLKYLTVYGFSTENWRRSEEEIQGLLDLLVEMIIKETPALHQKGVRLRHLGRLGELPSLPQQVIIQAIELTKNNTGMTFSFAFNYGGRTEILDAVRCLITEGIPAQKIDEQLFSNFLYTAGLPDIDMVIRTGGETRLSNFLMWQTAYSEYYFSRSLWPDFNETEVDKALVDYSRRKRRFGGD